MKVLVLGCRGWGEVHLRALSKLGVELSVYARTSEAVEECASKFEVSSTFTDINQALHSDADVVDVVLPHDLHAPVSVKAMKLGKDVTVEKPIAASLREAQEMTSTSRSSGRKLMVTEQFHFDPSVKRTKEIVESGKIGKVHTVIVRSQLRWSGSGWRREASHMGGGALIDGGVHFADTLLQLGGEYEDVAGYTYKGAGLIEGEDTGMAVFKFKGGAHGFFFYTWAYPNPPPVPRFEVVGSDGSVVDDVWNRPKGRMAPYGPLLVNGVREDVEDQDLYTSMFSQFFKAVEEGTDVPFPPELAVADLKAILDVYDASEKRRRV
ncbi:oxidoreductase [Sulfodiicoccus acidiphilus]|uniref:Oxidoreductase n=1 Tax=Sulfodiicoccus acidiphilus TaxID=1670455 RepID=A0A348B4Z5_9CREN|nr:Gfo/Idh/MocA family oxidoreductase [Sulfodiicoccus acidiphilus]BBD73247.1 oxidoreductase [Sulfodiicoccus acidiphilus]GGT89622.1 oxidoreductase [Sulfodiicoccus acidiphilus]